jgi:hypothetical protein
MNLRNPFSLHFMLPALLICLPSPGASEDMDPVTFPGNRYAQENSNAGTVSHWNTNVRVQFVDLATPEVQMAALTAFLSLGAASKSEMEIVGFPSTIFRTSSEIDPQTNLLVFEFDPGLNPNIVTGSDSLLSSGRRLPFPSGPIGKIGISGLIEQTPGCLARWNASVGNEIDGFVLAVSSELKTEERVACISTFSSTAFGVFPYVSLYDFSDLAESKGTRGYRYFADVSEIPLIVSAAAFCRDELGVVSIDCPYRAISRVFDHHADLLRDFGKN